MWPRRSFMPIAAFVICACVVVQPAVAQTGTLTVKVVGTGTVTIDGQLVIPKQTSDITVNSSMERQFLVTQYIISVLNHSEFRNPIKDIPYNRFVFRGTAAGPYYEGLKIIYDSSLTPPWKAIPIHAASETAECYLDCDGVRLYGSSMYPPCCPLPNGDYDCRCPNIGPGAYPRPCPDPTYRIQTRCGCLSDRCGVLHSRCHDSDPCCRPRRHRGLFGWLQLCN
jgi:hypothetical protein